MQQGNWRSRSSWLNDLYNSAKLLGKLEAESPRKCRQLTIRGRCLAIGRLGKTRTDCNVVSPFSKRVKACWAVAMRPSDAPIGGARATCLPHLIDCPLRLPKSELHITLGQFSFFVFHQRVLLVRIPAPTCVPLPATTNYFFHVRKS